VTTWLEARTKKTIPEERDAMLASCVAQGCTVNGWPATAPQRAMVEGNASALAYETSLRADLASTASPTTAKAAGSSWVDAAMSWFDLDNSTGGKGRILASKAAWDIPMIVAVAAAPITVDNTSTVQVQAADGTIFEASQVSKVTLNAASSYKGTVRFLARKAGTEGNVAPGQIVKVLAAPAGLTLDLTGTQVLVTSARDAETDDAYVTRGLGRWGTLGAGWTDTSFDYLIPRFAPTVTGWRVRSDNPLGPGTLQIVMRNAAGGSTSGENASVLAGLGNSSVFPKGSGGLSVVSASTLTITPSAAISSNGTNLSLLNAAIRALGILSANFPIGGDKDGLLPLELMRLAMIGAGFADYSVPGFAGATNVALAFPIGDVVMGASDIVVFNTSGIVLA
jgi:hypothetical protein